MLLCFPWLTCIIVQVDHMLYWLVTMCIIAHVHYLHFSYFMYHLTIIGIIKYWRYIEYRIQFADKDIPASHQIYQPVNILEHAPRIVPAVTLGKCVTPFIGAER